MGDLMVRPQNGAAMVTQGFGEQSVTPYAETAAQAVAAREKAAVEARYIIALQRPRNTEQFRVKLLEECKRPGFAEVARYSKPQGQSKVEGPSIRFVEAALRYFRNVDVSTTTVFDNADVRIIRVVVTDMEGNLGYASEVQVAKTVERKSNKGREVIGERVNSYGDKVYIVVATDDEILVKQAALISKSIRTLGLRLLPGDVVEEAQKAVVATISKGVVDDPKAALHRLIDAFAELKVLPEDLVAFANGKPLDRLQPKEITELRSIFAAIRDGETTWDEVMAERDPAGSAEAAQAVAAKKLGEMKRPTENPKQEGNAAGNVPSGSEQTETVSGQASVSPATTDGPAASDSKPRSTGRMKL